MKYFAVSQLNSTLFTWQNKQKPDWLAEEDVEDANVTGNW